MDPKDLPLEDLHRLEQELRKISKSKSLRKLADWLACLYISRKDEEERESRIDASEFHFRSCRDCVEYFVNPFDDAYCSKGKEVGIPCEHWNDKL